MTTVGICGMGYTGSGAVLDLLSEFDDVSIRENPEFSICYIPDGLEDLEYHLVKAPSRYMSSDIAINRFMKIILGRNTRGSGIRIATHNKYYQLSMEYIQSLIQVKWRGCWGFDFVTSDFFRRNFVHRLLHSRITPILGTIKKGNVDLPPIRDMYLSVNPERFYEKSRNYVNSLIEAMDMDTSKTVVLNQPFAADHPTKSFTFFDNPMAVIVDRDPRDIYVLMKRITLDEGRFIPTREVRDFVAYYRIIRENQEDISERKDVLKIQFEDLIYKYDDTLESIKRFLGLANHSRKKTCFRPEISMNNTQLFRRYPEFQKDVAVISEELSEWLYPFEQFDEKPDWKSQSF